MGTFKQGHIKSICEQLQSCKITIHSIVSIATPLPSTCPPHRGNDEDDVDAADRDRKRYQTTDNQIADIRTRREEFGFVDRAQAPADPETEADMLRQTDEEHKALYRSRRLLNELLVKVQESTIANVMARNENDSTRVTFGNGNLASKSVSATVPSPGLVLAQMSA